MDELGAGRDARLRQELHELEDSISNGWGVPERFYRLGVDQNRDLLLDETGIKHLHLDGRGSNILVYLVELDERVIILRIAGHAYLEDHPRGSFLRRILLGR